MGRGHLGVVGVVGGSCGDVG
jgi:hypothetical protein